MLPTTTNFGAMYTERTHNEHTIVQKKRENHPRKKFKQQFGRLNRKENHDWDTERIKVGTRPHKSPVRSASTASTGTVVAFTFGGLYAVHSSWFSCV